MSPRSQHWVYLYITGTRIWVLISYLALHSRARLFSLTNYLCFLLTSKSHAEVYITPHVVHTVCAQQTDGRRQGDQEAQLFVRCGWQTRGTELVNAFHI